MGLYVYKMFNPGLKCRGYQFREGVNECEHAHCVREGFHAAENPLDCLSYYPDFDASECWLCYATGDVHEDGSDSKISCTRLEILRRLRKWDFVYEALRYVADHPHRSTHRLIRLERAEDYENGFVIVKGEHPLIRPKKEGDVLAWITTDESGRVLRLGIEVCTADMVGKWIGDNGEETSVCE